MKKIVFCCLLSSCAAALSSCATIDETRYAGVPCADLKQIIEGENLMTLSQYGAGNLDGGSSGDLFDQARAQRGGLDALDVFDFDKDTKYRAELRAAFRNNCS